MLDRLLDISTNLGVDTLLLLPVLIALEAVLSADNAIALAAIAQGLQSEKSKQQALNVGLVIAYGLRVALILTASWILHFWQFEVAGAAYLLWLVYQHFTADTDEQNHHHGPRFESIWQAVPTIALTDLAFSLDSVTTAIALSRDVWIVLLGGTVGVVILRFMAQLFIRWLEEFEYLEDAGFITVALVGLRLLIRVVNPEWVPPQWLMIGLIAVIFAWGFSKKTQPQSGSALAEESATLAGTNGNGAAVEPNHAHTNGMGELPEGDRQPAGVASPERDQESTD